MHNQRHIGEEKGQTSSGFLEEAMTSLKLNPGAIDNPAPRNAMTLFSPISFSTWRTLELRSTGEQN